MKLIPYLVLASLLFSLGTASAAGVRGSLAPPTADALKAALDFETVPQPLCEPYASESFAGPAMYCVITSSHPLLAVLGDSHAHTLSVALAAVTNVGISYVGLGSCIPLLGVIKVQKVVGEDVCHGLSQSRDELKKIVGGSRIVIITGDATSYIEDPQIRTTLANVSGNEPDDKLPIFVDGLDALVSYLESLGKEVVYVDDNPALTFTLTNCADLRPVHLGGFTLQSPCAVPYASYAAETKRLHSALDEVAQRHPHLRVFREDRLLCDAHWCYVVFGDQVFYRDGNHLSLAGAEFIARKLLDYLRTNFPGQLP